MHVAVNSESMPKRETLPFLFHSHVVFFNLPASQWNYSAVPQKHLVPRALHANQPDTQLEYTIRADGRDVDVSYH